MTMTRDITALQALIEEAATDRAKLESADHRAAVEDTIAGLDDGELRMAEKVDGEWGVNGWIQQAILLYFQLTEMKTMHAGPLEYYDRIPLKLDLKERGIRMVPGGIARYGAHIEPGVVMMPGFVNIGAYVGTGTMVDTWATVGSGAQIGRNVHLAGGVGIGGVLEPVGARPVIVEDDAFIGSRCIVVEGVIVEEGAVLGAQVSLSASTHIIDVTGDEPVTHVGRVPAGSIVIPGTRTRTFPAGDFQVACALIIGKRDQKTERKLQPMEAARAFGFSL
jgi:2,3,4,5-tetrahydropyridine-2,6-dicarboxylate N-succinyltransferase